MLACVLQDWHCSPVYFGFAKQLEELTENKELFSILKSIITKLKQDAWLHFLCPQFA
jgi:hypothetical protein